MIPKFYVEPGAPQKIGAYLERVRANAMKALRDGMREAMTELAQYVVASKLAGNPIHSRLGALAAAILASVRVGGNENYVRGTIADKPPRMPNEGIWQEFGTQHAADLSGKLRVFVGPDGAPVFTRKIGAYQVAPKPFMNPSLEERRRQVIETIRARLTAAHLDAA
jgi:hypothetical protein